jgi:hypothetical protein
VGCSPCDRRRRAWRRRHARLARRHEAHSPLHAPDKDVRNGCGSTTGWRGAVGLEWLGGQRFCRRQRFSSHVHGDGHRYPILRLLGDRRSLHRRACRHLDTDVYRVGFKLTHYRLSKPPPIATTQLDPRCASYVATSLVDARLSQILHLFFRESGLNIYAGEFKVRPPAAPTTGYAHGPQRVGKPFCRQESDRGEGSAGEHVRVLSARIGDHTLRSARHLNHECT